MTDPELLAAIDETIPDSTSVAIGVPWPRPDPSHGMFGAALRAEVVVERATRVRRSRRGVRPEGMPTVVALALVLLAACGPRSAAAPAQPRVMTPPEAPAVTPTPAIAPSPGGPAARKVVSAWDTLPPVISGGWQGSPIEVRDAPPLPAGWSGLAIEYQRGPHADGPWYFEKDGSRLLSEDRRRVVRTYLLWHAPTQEGIVINPTARDAAHAIELARAQPGIRWRLVIDTITDAATSPKLAGKDWVAWREQVAFKGAGVGLRDYEKPWRDKLETVAAATVAKELGANTITRGQLAPTTLAADKLLVYRSYMDNPHDRALIVEWGPFEVMSDWHD